MMCPTRLALLDRYNDAVNPHAELVKRLSDLAGNGSPSNFESLLRECVKAKQLVGEVYDELFRRASSIISWMADQLSGPAFATTPPTALFPKVECFQCRK